MMTWVDIAMGSIGLIGAAQAVVLRTKLWAVRGDLAFERMITTSQQDSLLAKADTIGIRDRQRSADLASIERLLGEISVLARERNEANRRAERAEDELNARKARKSRQISQGNRTRAAKRRLPFPPSNDTGFTADLRIEATG